MSAAARRTTQDEGDPAPGWRRVAACLPVAARHLGLRQGTVAIAWPGGGDGPLDSAALEAGAAQAGLRCEGMHLPFAELARLGRDRAAILRFRDGSAMVLVRVDTVDGATRVILEDPDAGRDAPLVLDRQRFLGAWDGEVLVVRRRHRLAGDDRPFGLGLIGALIVEDRRLVAEVAASALAISLLALAPIVFLRLLTVRVMEYRSLDTLTVLAIVMAGLIAIETAMLWSRRTMADRLAAKVDVKLWRLVFSRVLGLPIEHFEVVPAGLTVYRVNLLHKVRALLLTQLMGVLLDAGVLVFFVPVMLMISVPLTLMILVAFVVIVAWILLVMPGYRRRSALAERAEATRGSFLFQSIAGIRTVKSLALDARQRRQWAGLTDEAVALREAASNRGNLLQSVVTVLERLLILGTMGGGAYLALQSDDPVSLTTLFAFVLLSQRVVAPLQQIAQLIQQSDEARTAVDDIAALVNQPAEEGRSGHGVRTALAGEIAFTDVRFTYRGAAAPALRDVRFTVRPGMTFGIMGRSGSGKTTITRLLQRLHADYRGAIRIDGVEVREYDVDHLRASLGVVLQENFLFSGTIFENIAAARSDATHDEVVHAARLAGAEEFIDKLPGGYGTVIYEGSPNLSGGQRQRIAIARALITDPKILILDEATSALDAESEAILNQNLRHIAVGRTTLVISHRLRSLMACDAILVLDGGAVHDIGTHAELLERCDIYAGLWAHQNAHAGQDDAARAGRRPVRLDGPVPA